MHPPQSLRGQRSYAYLISSEATVCYTFPAVKGSQNFIVHSIVHSSRAIRDTCTMYVHVQYTPIRVHGSQVPGSRVPGSPIPRVLRSTEYSIPSPRCIQCSLCVAQCTCIDCIYASLRLTP